MFGDSAWYKSLEEPTDDAASACYVAKSKEHWASDLLSSGAQFAIENGLLDTFRAKFRGIRALDLAEPRAAAEHRLVSSPIWAIAHELIVARYLATVLGWTFEKYEPLGHKATHGDWQFRTPSGRSVFTEVKTLEESEPCFSQGAYSRPIHFERIRNVVKGAYQQLPDDNRATLVVFVGREILSISHGIMLGDLFQTMFGQFQVRFTPMSDDPDYRAGPSFRDMLVHRTKHRRLGCIAGLQISGTEIPYVQFYAIDNPFAHLDKRLHVADVAAARRFFINDSGEGLDERGCSLEEVWQRMRNSSPVSNRADG